MQPKNGCWSLVSIESKIEVPRGMFETQKFSNKTISGGLFITFQLCALLITQFLLLVGRLGSSKPVLPHQFYGSIYSNWQPKVDPQSLLSKFWWRLCVVSFLSFSYGKTVFVIELNPISSFFSYLGQENPTRTPVLGNLIRNGLSGTVDCWHCLMTLLFMTSQRMPLHYPRHHRRFQWRWMLILWTNSFKTPKYFRYEKNNQLLVSDPEWQISVSGDTVLRLDWDLWHRITLDRDLSLWNRY